MNTSSPSPQDSAKKRNDTPSEVAGPKVGLGSTSNIGGIRNPNDANARSGSQQRSASAQGTRDDDAARGQVADAFNAIVDAMDVLVREVPRGAQAQFGSVQEKLTKARASIKAYCDTSKSDERSTQRMENEGSNPSKSAEGSNPSKSAEGSNPSRSNEGSNPSRSNEGSNPSKSNTSNRL